MGIKSLGEQLHREDKRQKRTSINEFQNQVRFAVKFGAHCANPQATFFNRTTRRAAEPAGDGC